MRKQQKSLRLDTVCIQNTFRVCTEYDEELLNLLNYFLGTHISLKGLFGSLYFAIFTFQFLNLASPQLPLHYGKANYTLDAHYMNAIDRLDIVHPVFHENCTFRHSVHLMY